MAAVARIGVELTTAKAVRNANKLKAAVNSLKGSSVNASNSVRGFGKAAGAAGVAARGLGAAAKAALGPIGLLAGAAGALVSGFKGFVEADKARAAVRTLGVDVKTLEGQLVGVVARTKGLASTNDLLAASYDVASAGFGKAADITKILEASLLGAVGGMTDIGTVSDAATSVMNAFGLTTDSVAKIVDGFVQTQNDGKIVVGQYASQIGRVAPIAAAAGVGIDELNAAISTITAQGVPVESTFSGLNQVIASVVKPTSEAAKAAKRLGLDFSSAAIKTKGFGGFLTDLIEKTGGSEVEITKLFGSVDALKALMPLISGDLEKFNKNLENQKNATGAAGDAADIMGETVSSQISRIVNNITTLVRGLDQVLGPAIKGILDLINSVISAAVTAVAKLTEMFQMNRARTQAREELGGTMGRGTTKADPAAVEARALEIFKASQASTAAAAAPTVPTPQNNIQATGGLDTASSKLQKEKVTMTQKEFDLRKAVLDAKNTESKIDDAHAEFALKKFQIGEQFNDDVLARRIGELKAEHALNQDLQKIEQDRVDAAAKAAQEEADRRQKELEADPMFQMKQKMEELLDVQNQVAAGAQVIGNAFAGAFKSVITGSKTAGEALKDMLAATAEHFLDMAMQIIAQQITMIIYGSIMKALGVGLPTMKTGPAAGLSADFTQADPSTLSSLGFKFAEGGYVSGPTRALVGEGGEPEYVIPESKMRESMSRYSRGARGSAVVEGQGESGTTEDTAGLATSTPIDVRYTVDRINSVDYVTADQFQNGMRQAANQGAKQGEQQALRRLQMSGSTRKRLGM